MKNQKKIPSLPQLLCPHKRRMIRFSDDRILTVCFDCGQESPGVEVGGFVYSPEAQARIKHPKALGAGWESLT